MKVFVCDLWSVDWLVYTGGVCVATSGNFVNWTIPTQTRQLTAATSEFFGWRLENRLWLKELHFNVAGNVSTLLRFTVRAGIGREEPASIAVLDSFKQLIAGDDPALSATTRDLNYFGSQPRYRCPINRYAESGEILAVGIEASGDSSILCSLDAWM